MNPAIKSKLDEFKARRERATPGPWEEIGSPVSIERINIWNRSLNEEVCRAEGTTKNTEFIAASRTEHAQLEEALRVAVEALDFASKQTVSILEGRIRLNFNGDESGPGLTFYEGETWLLGDRAKEALERIAKILGEKQ